MFWKKRGGILTHISLVATKWGGGMRREDKTHLKNSISLDIECKKDRLNWDARIQADGPVITISHPNAVPCKMP